MRTKAGSKREREKDARHKQTQAQVRQLEKLTTIQEERIKRLNRAKFRIRKSPQLTKSRGSFYRVIVPDTHGDHADMSALGAFLADLRSIAPQVREIIMLGDHLDCSGFLAEHHTLGYVAETVTSFEDDMHAANTLLDEIQSICPKAVIHYLEGNHERRIERWCVTKVLKEKNCTSGNRDFLLRKYLETFATENVLHLEKRNIHYYKQAQFYMGMRIPATIRLGRCHFTHGSRTGRNPAAAMLADFGGNVVFGHVHRIDSASGRSVKEGEMGAWSPGCLCQLQPLWNHTQITGWSHGYGLQIVRTDGDFLHINVPIISGRSYLMHLTGKVA